MVSFGEKTKIKKAGNLNSGRSYVITTVKFSAQMQDLAPFFRNVTQGITPFDIKPPLINEVLAIE